MNRERSKSFSFEDKFQLELKTLKAQPARGKKINRPLEAEVKHEK